MFEHKEISNLNDFFVELSSRQSKGVFFYRINGFNNEICQFIRKYYEAARVSGVIIEGKIPNPDEKNLSYYNEIMGMNFQMSLGFFTSSLMKWLPRMNDYQRNNVASSIYDSLDSLRKAGKNENMLKNAYIKFMCWLYYKFERIVNQLGEEKIPKILYEGEISSYELMLISVLSNAGCDVVLLQYGGDQSYLKLDPDSVLSNNLAVSDMKAFPETFNLKWIQSEILNAMNNERLYGRRPEISNCTNAWIQGKGLDDIRTSIANRGSDSKLFYNCYCRINGVEDKLTYMNDLYQFQLELKNSKRKVVVVDEIIPQPSMEEINSINRKNYSKQDQMLMDLSNNIQYTANIELQRLMIQSFVDVILDEAKIPGMNLNKLTNKAVYLVCWIKRYQSMLFSNWKMPDISCFIYMGGCKNENEAMFIRFLARLPVDVLILNPNLNCKCCLEDQLLYEQNFVQTLVVNKFPQENSDVHIGTAAYHAERELDTLMYQDSGMYRNQQYTKANTVTLQTMYEEIALLWKEELKYRPHFSIVDEVVNIPAIFAKVSGVKDGVVPQYWSGIKALIEENTFIIKKVPFIEPTAANPMKAHTTEFLKNGKVQKAKIKGNSNYQYGFLREEIQNYILDKLQLLIDQKVIRGTFENGTEYTIVSTVLNLPKDILRMIQKFDFTKKNPKLIYINTGESMIPLEDSILVAFLNLVGFDVAFFVPTGYQNVEKHFSRQLMEEHQIGEYVYDLQIPNWDSITSNTLSNWRKKIFKRGT
ncbi:YceG family protein [Anaeromicropila populeti]|uniref:Putative component of 'biosynthetic module n=1 Tax=Anaeromicropila populeti TaxID=37658 RepID=A0A1I6IF73_9FIRM|nr:YceG family protein [Anaeromicropila populeti]SFR65333.1 Putative component of 'biosynthetic module' [Anaeromicropila populeti]